MSARVSTLNSRISALCRAPMARTAATTTPGASHCRHSCVTPPRLGVVFAWSAGWVVAGEPEATAGIGRGQFSIPSLLPPPTAGVRLSPDWNANQWIRPGCWAAGNGLGRRFGEEGGSGRRPALPLAEGLSLTRSALRPQVLSSSCRPSVPWFKAWPPVKAVAPGSARP